MLFVASSADAQDSSIYVQCPTDTVLHPDTDADPLTREAGIECKHLSGGDGMVTMADATHVEDGVVVAGGKPLYIFSFADIPLPGAADPYPLVDYPYTDPLNPTAPSDTAEYPGYVMERGMLTANAPAPTIVVDEDDEVFLTLTNVGMAMRPDLFDPHTVHWHGFPQAASIFDGVPDASVSVNMGASLTYYYNAKDAGTYMYHCHVEATEHMQMGMLGSLYVRPRQNKLADGADLSDAFGSNGANIVNGGTTPAPAIDTGAAHATGATYAYNDGDGSTRYDVQYPIQIGSFDGAFHDASIGVQPLPFADMKDDYFLLNGRGYPDTANSGVMSTVDPLGKLQASQPVSSLITASAGQKVLLRISNLNVTIFNTLATNGPPMEVVGLDARLLRDADGNNMYYKTNSLTLGGGQSADVIIDTGQSGTFFLYTTNLDRLANGDENFGGQMTEIRITASAP